MDDGQHRTRESVDKVRPRRTVELPTQRSGRRRKESSDRMEQILEEARDKDLLHGRTGRVILSSYEGRKNARWNERGALSGIVGTIIVLIGATLNWPAPVLLVLFVCFAAVVVTCLSIGWFHVIRMLDIRYSRQTPDEDARIAAFFTDGKGDNREGDRGGREDTSSMEER